MTYMDILRNIGSLALGSRFRRLSDQLMQDGILIYRECGVNFEPRWFPVYYYLSEQGPSAVTDVARGLGVTHPSVNQIAKEMMADGLIASYKDRMDKRKRVLALTSAGKAKIQELKPVWDSIEEVLQALIDETDKHFLVHIQAMETALSERGFKQRFFATYQKENIETDIEMEVLDFRPELADAFRTLNEEWINEFFEMEEADRKTLDHPARSIIEPGGEIIFLREKVSGKVVGTCAIARRDDALCELVKMAVARSARGTGLGRQLGEAAIKVARDLGFMKIYLETNSRLLPARALYHKLGFEQKEFPHSSDYSRADVYMELSL